MRLTSLCLLALVFAAVGDEVQTGEQIPAFSRGAIPNYMTPEPNREDGVSRVGRSTGRWRTFLNKLATGQGGLMATFVGASVTVGNGIDGHGYGYVRYMEYWFEDAFPGQVKVVNAGVPAVMSSYFAICSSLHVPEESDVIFVDFALNDQHVTAPVDGTARRPMERLLRKLLSLPKKPAVVFVHAYSWPIVKGAFWESAERDFHEYELYYDLPAVSVKACCYHLMRTGVDGFRIDKSRYEEPEKYRFHVFYGDGLHPDGPTGARVLSELLIWLIIKDLEQLKQKPLQEIETAALQEPLPPPVVPGNEPPASERCYVASGLQAIVKSHDGWEWDDESAFEGKKRQKWGFSTSTVGAPLRVVVNTTLPAPPPGKSQAGGEQKPAEAQVMIAHLRSYKGGMGQALVSCESGCTCNKMKLEGHQDREASLMHVENILVSQHPECTISIAVAESSSSGGHKFKVQGIFVSEKDDAPLTGGALDNFQAGRLIGIDQ